MLCSSFSVLSAHADIHMESPNETSTYHQSDKHIWKILSG